MRIADALAVATEMLQSAGVVDAARDARRMMAAALDMPHHRITLVAQDDLAPAAKLAFFTSVEKRARRQPMSHILGERLFYDRQFKVTPDVLDPRPETETLIAAALEAPFERVLDLGTGSGAILVTLLAERPAAVGIGTDVSQAALRVAGDNAVAHGVDGRAQFESSDWFAAVGGRYDLIVSNPPYIAADEMKDLQPEVRLHEPRLALTDEGDGLGAYRAITAGAPAHLRPGGRLIVEIGPTQGQAVAAMMQAVGLGNIRVLPDLDGRDRVVCAVRGP